MGNVARIYLQRMEADKALSLFEEALAGLRAKFPPLHPERMVATQSLARAYHAAEQIDRALPLQELVTGQFKTAHGIEDRYTQNCIDDLIAYYVDVGACDKAEALLKSIRVGDDNRSASDKQRQEQREKRHRELIARVKPAAEKYQEELAAKKSDHPDTLAARQAFAVALRGQKRTTAAAYHVNAVLDARQRVSGVDHLDTQLCRLELAQTRLMQRRYADSARLLLDVAANMNRTRSEEQTNP
jgi:tetratricopeptide (TPR) repeat protein